MDLINPQPRCSVFALYVVISVVALVTQGYPQFRSSSPCINQTPRNLTFNEIRPPFLSADSPKRVDYNFVSTTPLVILDPAKDPNEIIYYQGQTLHRCDQHYHAPVENVQGCPGEKQGHTPEHKELPPPGQWIEVHTVYALKVDSDGACADHLDHNLSCCRTPPFVVRGFSAKVASGPYPPVTPVVPTPTSGPLAEWLGSNTSPDDATNCKPLPVQWSFRFGCSFTINQDQLKIFEEAHKARELQTGNRLSNDLTLVAPDSSLLDAQCRKLPAGPIANDAMAKRICPGVCQVPLNRFSGKWNYIVPETAQNVPGGGAAECLCCPSVRPQ